MMTVDELMQKIILEDITLSQGLMLCKVMYKDVLPEESYLWISYELDHYEDAKTIPDYRIIDCSLKARISGPYFGTKVEELDTSIINRQLESSDKAYASPNKMLVRQGIESIEESLKDAGSFAQMDLHQGQIELLLKYYSCPQGCRIEKMYQECRREQLRNIIPSVRNKLISILQDIIDNRDLEQVNDYSKNKTVFISYGWDNDEHTAWVKSLAERLSKLFDVKIDVQQPFGTELNAFMEQMISKSDRVLLILTPKYKEKADTRQNGVGYESVLISSELYRNQGTTKFIPIIRKGEISESYPLYLGTRKGLDMRNDVAFEEKLAELIEDIRSN